MTSLSRGLQRSGDLQLDITILQIATRDEAVAHAAEVLGYGNWKDQKMRDF